MQTDSIQLAHVADAIERLSGGEAGDYDTTAEFAHNVLSAHPAVRTAVREYMDSTIGEPEFDAAVSAAVHSTG